MSGRCRPCACLPDTFTFTRDFVRDAMTNPQAASIVRAVIDMAQNLRLTVIAEGVETEQQAGFLRRHGCDQAQGHFYGQPVSAEKIGERLARAQERRGR